MIHDETIRELTRIGTARMFQPQDYICSEGQPGSEMYIILRGEVGVYISGADDSQVEVARLREEDFFGEMALLDNQPRSASCVALSSVLCAEIGKDKLQQFIAVCPAIAMKILESLSLRIRGLSNALYKSESAAGQAADAFEIPAEYSASHHVAEPPYNRNVLNPVTGACPLCGGTVTANNVKKLHMTVGDPRKDGRTLYKECDPLWHSIWSCPRCRYSNYYSRFFAVSAEESEAIRQMLDEQQIPAIAQRPDLTSPFDNLVLHYLQAIHINQAGSRLLAGRLWLNLYWLFDDANDPVMKKYCGERSTAALTAALDAGEVPDEKASLMIKLSLTDMYAATGNKDAASAVCGEVLSSTSHLQIRQLASELKRQYKL